MLLTGVVLLSGETIRGRLSVASNCFPIFALPKAASHRFAKPMSKVPSHESIWRPPHYVDQSFVRHHQINRCKIFPRGSGLHKRDKPPRWKNWLRGLDLNQRPSGYEPDELPGCSTPRFHYVATDDEIKRKTPFTERILTNSRKMAPAVGFEPTTNRLTADR